MNIIDLFLDFCSCKTSRDARKVIDSLSVDELRSFLLITHTYLYMLFSEFEDD